MGTQSTTIIAAIATITTLTLAPATAAADGMTRTGNDEFVAILLGAYTLELLVPDLQAEFGDPDVGTNLILAWPIAASLLAVEPIHSHTLGLKAVVEPQHRPAADRTRTLALGRAEFGHMEPDGEPGLGVYMEYGHVFSPRGGGQVVGGGTFWGISYVSLGVGYRQLHLGERGRRETLTLDLHLAVPIL